MRIATITSDRGYHPKAGEGVLVTVGGVPMKNCVIADDEEGVAVCLATDLDGNLIYDPNDGSRLQVVTYTGKVRIVLPYELAVELTP